MCVAFLAFYWGGGCVFVLFFVGGGGGECVVFDVFCVVLAVVVFLQALYTTYPSYFQ